MDNPASPVVALVQLNELNVDLLNKYVNETPDRFPNLKKLLSDFRLVETSSEEQYENLEPWIQWVSVYTGLDYSQHQISNLGDGAKDVCPPTIYEVIESNGLGVAAVAPMNAPNRLGHPCFFIPDPWCDSKPDRSRISNRISRLVKQSVNDNAKGTLTISSLATLVEIVFRFVPVRSYLYLLRLVWKSLNKKWMRALIFDFLMHNIYLTSLKKYRPDFSSVFLNGFAHIQHHYLLNSRFIESTCTNPGWYIDQNDDPFEFSLYVYDKIVGEYLDSSVFSNFKILVATGLSQRPYDRQKYYYRLTKHEDFLSDLGIHYSSVQPLMTRDFYIFFHCEADMATCISSLSSCTVKGKRVFQLKKSGTLALFVTLGYPEEVHSGDKLICNGDDKGSFLDNISFVALKNGMHSSRGYALFSPSWVNLPADEKLEVWGLANIILKECGVDHRLG